jgi:diadenosine tetraphosphate (Ap4A) HIT family hydrolase
MISDFFELDQRLKNDGEIIANLKLSTVIFVNNRYFPWIIMVPMKNNVKEIIDLSDQEKILLMEEISIISALMNNIFKPDKLNIAALGNIVQQLHIHVIARYKTDIAWPNPAFGSSKETYPQEKYQELIVRIKSYLQKMQSK